MTSEYWDRQIDTFGYPLIAIASNGGPFDTESFISGMHTASIGIMLGLAAEDQDFSEAGMVPTRVLEQLDLVALHNGYILTSKPIEKYPGWSDISFVKMNMDDFDIEDTQ